MGKKLIRFLVGTVLAFSTVFFSFACSNAETFVDGEIGHSYREFVVEGEDNVTKIRITPPYEDSDYTSVFKKDSYVVSDSATVSEILTLLRGLESKVTRVQQNDQEYVSGIHELTTVDLNSSGSYWLVNRYQLQLYNREGEHLAVTVYEDGMAIVRRGVGRAYFECADGFSEQMFSIERLMTTGALEQGSIDLFDIEIY